MSIAPRLLPRPAPRSAIPHPHYYQHHLHHHHQHHQWRSFHDYFVTHLPSSSLHPDSRSPHQHHKLPRDKSTPHDGQALNRPAAAPPSIGPGARDLTVVRIPLRSAKHHFGASFSRGQRPYNEDAFQAGTIELPAFAKRRPMSLTRKSNAQEDGGSSAASTTTGDPQVFYFGVFDGHGGSECSDFLRDRLHGYIEDGAQKFQVQSSLQGRKGSLSDPPQEKGGGSEESVDAAKLEEHAIQKEQSLVRLWKGLVGGYFRRFKPEYFAEAAGGKGQPLVSQELRGKSLVECKSNDTKVPGAPLEAMLEWSFLKADYDFVKAQVKKVDSVKEDRAINDDDILGKPSQRGNSIGGPKRFQGGSTCSIALISTPTPMPFWNPASPSTIITAHVGDTRILLCDTKNGNAHALTSVHHPNHPIEAQRMRRYAATFVTDSFGEERVQGLANTRAFGDMSSKGIGVSAEPELTRVELSPAEYSFLVLVSDGICGHVSDEEIVDIVKEARTPEEGSKNLVSYATEISEEGDNATALVVRLGGWERRNEGGGGSMRTRETRNFRREEALDPRSRQR
jgi:protein phosphatase PTC6